VARLGVNHAATRCHPAHVVGSEYLRMFPGVLDYILPAARYLTVFTMLMSRCSFGLLRSWFRRSRFIEEQQPVPFYEGAAHSRLSAAQQDWS